jgi:hypothetical protein
MLDPGHTGQTSVQENTLHVRFYLRSNVRQAPGLSSKRPLDQRTGRKCEPLRRDREWVGSPSGR